MDNLNNIPSTGNFGDVADKLNDNFNKVNIAVETINSKYVRNKGYFPTLTDLQTAFPSPKIGDTAYVANVASSSGYYFANVVGGIWVETTTVAPAMSINASEYAKHGYSTTPKTLKQLDDGIVQLAGDVKILGTPFDISKNLADKSKIVAGTYLNPDTNINVSASWISILISGLKSEVDYTVSGVMKLGTSVERFRFYNSSGVMVGSVVNSNNETFQTIQLPAGATQVAVSIANVLNIGLTPTNNQYANSAQFEIGDSVTSYMPFGIAQLKKTQVDNLTFSELTTISKKLPLSINELNSNKANAGGSLKSMKQIDDEKISESDIFNNSVNIANKETIVGGTYGSTTLIVSPSANWISLLIDNVVSGLQYTVSGIAAIGSSIERFRFYNSAGVFLSGLNSNGLTSQTIVVPANATKVAIAVANAVGVGNNPTTNQWANTIQFEIGSTVSPYEYFGVKTFKTELLKSYPKMFVKLMPYTGAYSGTMVSFDAAYIYEHINENRYAKHTLKYEELAYEDYVSGDFHGGKIVRYAGAKLSTYDVNTFIMTDTSTELVLQLESEFVMESGGWIGGYHGNEFMDAVYFIINGKIHNISGTLNFPSKAITEVDSFSYIVGSKMYHDTTKTLFCNRNKVSDFCDGGFKIRTKLLDFQQAVTTLFYTGINCIGINLGDKVLSEDGQIYTPLHNESILFQGKKIRAVYYSHATNNLSGRITGRVYNEIHDNNSTVMVWDRSTDSKYYRMVTFTPIIGSSLEFESKFEIK